MVGGGYLCGIAFHGHFKFNNVGGFVAESVVENYRSTFHAGIHAADHCIRAMCEDVGELLERKKFIIP